MERRISKVLEPTAIDIDAAQNGHTAAVVICHGMGQQVKWQTLCQLVGSLARAGRLEPGFEPGVRQVRFTDEGEEFFLGRVELLARNRDRSAVKHVHVYEAYWAPLTEGRITLRQTVAFLFSAGRSGISQVFRTFYRYWPLAARNGEPPVKAFRSTKGVLLGFGLSLLILLALVVMNGAITLTQLRQLTGNVERPDERALLAALTGDLWTFGLVMGVYVLATRVALVYRARKRGLIASWFVPVPVQWLLWAVTGGVLVATILIGLIAIPWHYVSASSGASAQHNALLYWPLRAPADTAQAWLRAALTWMSGSDGGALASLDPLTVHAWIVWGLVIYASYRVRGILVQYIGDVAIYVSHHTVSSFDEARDAIKTVARRVLCAVCEQGGYERVIVVGHSLGSVVAYDALNGTMLAEDVAVKKGGSRFHVERIRRFITFGSPLDKTAFIFRSADADDAPVREALAVTVQPLLVYRPSAHFDWVNIYSPNDVISGALDYYAQVTTNLVDSQADIPLWAHTQFWSNGLLAHQLADACLDDFRSRAAPRAYEAAVAAEVSAMS